MRIEDSYINDCFKRLEAFQDVAFPWFLFTVGMPFLIIMVILLLPFYIIGKIFGKVKITTSTG